MFISLFYIFQKKSFCPDEIRCEYKEMKMNIDVNINSKMPSKEWFLILPLLYTQIHIISGEPR